MPPRFSLDQDARTDAASDAGSALPEAARCARIGVNAKTKRKAGNQAEITKLLRSPYSGDTISGGFTLDKGALPGA
jgi:hypothetical protein